MSHSTQSTKGVVSELTSKMLRTLIAVALVAAASAFAPTGNSSRACARCRPPSAWLPATAVCLLGRSRILSDAARLNSGACRTPRQQLDRVAKGFAESRKQAKSKRASGMVKGFVCGRVHPGSAPRQRLPGCHVDPPDQPLSDRSEDG
jgi:hypothetical protein